MQGADRREQAARGAEIDFDLAGQAVSRRFSEPSLCRPRRAPVDGFDLRQAGEVLIAALIALPQTSKYSLMIRPAAVSARR